MQTRSTTRRLVLARHGEVQADWRRRIYGRLNVPLSATGEDEMRALAARFAGIPFERVVSSGLARAEFGARLLREPLGLSRHDESDLREIDRGAWAGRTYEEIETQEPGAFAAWNLEPGRLSPALGENLESVRSRVVLALKRILHETTADVAVVAHSWVLRVTLCHVSGIPLDRAPGLSLPTGGALLIDFPRNASFDAVKGRDVHIAAWNPTKNIGAR